MKKNEKSKIGGFTANSLVIPLGLILAILIIAIIFLTVSVTWTTADLADIMQKSSDYQQTATKLQVGTSVLSETSSAFIQIPVIPGGPNAGTLNMTPLQAYMQELRMDRRAPEVAATFREYGANEEILGHIDTATYYSEQMRSIQTHAVSLILSVYSLPDDPAFSIIPRIDLTDEELAMSNDERVATARSLIANKDYILLKSYINESIDKCHQVIQIQFDTALTECKEKIFILRTVLWTMIALLFIVLIVIFYLFYRWLVMPLRQYSKDMASDKTLKQKGHVRELRSMVSVYNDLFDRRNKLESILRTAAETDALTGLPNRYHLEQTIINFDKSNGSLAVLLFDVNFLKLVNDTKGHLAGDQLLRDAASIIAECFGKKNVANCYRIGGDEFAAVLRDSTEKEIKTRIEAFEQALQQKGISVSVGYAIAEKADRKTFDQLMVLADERMYAQKKQIHSRFTETEEVFTTEE